MVDKWASSGRLGPPTATNLRFLSCCCERKEKKTHQGGAGAADTAAAASAAILVGMVAAAGTKADRLGPMQEK